MKHGVQILGASALLAASCANAALVVTPAMLGYGNTFAGSNKQAANWQDSGAGVNREDGVSVGASVGLELSSNLIAELEWLRHDADAYSQTSNSYEFDAHSLSLNLLATSDLPQSFGLSGAKSYFLAGLGYGNTKIKDASGSNVSTTDEALANTGAGFIFPFADAFALRTEGRFVHHFEDDYIDAMLLVGLQFTPQAPAKAPGLAAEVAQVTEVSEQELTPLVPKEIEPAPFSAETPEVNRWLMRLPFATGKSTLDPVFDPQVREIAQVLQTEPKSVALVMGHASKTGNKAYNEKLALSRAEHLKQRLISDYKISAERITIHSFNWNKPLGDNNTPEGRAMNQRVDVVLIIHQ